jgi:hypothetical protein
MAKRDTGRTSHDSSRNDEWMDQDDRVRGRADEMEDASRDDEDVEDTDDLGEEDEDEGTF